MASSSQQQQQFTKADVLQNHRTRASFYIVIRNHVYDVAEFMDDHPGGRDVFTSLAAKLDFTEDYDQVMHTPSANDEMSKYLVGTLADADTTTQQQQQHPASGYTPAYPTNVNKRNKDNTMQFLVVVCLVAFGVLYFVLKTV